MNDLNASNDIKQQLSELIDGELDNQRARFLLRRLGADEQLCVSWSRWHTTRACMRRETSGALRADFALTISQAIADEAAPRRAAVGGQMLRWVGGFAVAASVAVAALLAVPLGQEQTPSQSESPAIAGQAPAPAALVAASSLTERDLRPNLGRVTQTVAATTDARSLTPALRLDPQLQTYLLRHNAAVRSSGNVSYLPLVPVVAPVRPWTMLPAASESPSP